MRKEIILFAFFVFLLFCFFTGCTIIDNDLSIVSIEPVGVSPFLPFDKIVFNVNDSLDADDAISSYSWDFGDGSELNGSAVVHYYDSVGEYSVKLSAFDSDSNLVGTKTKTVSVVSVPVFSLVMEKTNEDETLGVMDFDITVAATTGHSVELDDVSFNVDFFVDDVLVDSFSTGLDAGFYYDFDGDGFVSAGDYVNYTYNPIFLEVYSDNVTSFSVVFEYETHFAFNINGPVVLGMVSWDLD